MNKEDSFIFTNLEWERTVGYGSVPTKRKVDQENIKENTQK